MKNRKLWIIFISVLLSMFLFTVVGNADFGDFAGDSDYGDSGDSGWDSGGYDSDDDDWDWGSDDDDDWNWGGNSYGSSGVTTDPIEMDENASLFFGILVVVGIPALILFLLIRRGRSKRKKTKPVLMPGATPMVSSSLKSMAKYNEVDPGFSADALREQISNRYVQFQNAWQEKDISSLRPYLSDALYAQMDRQLDANYRKTGHTNHIERIAVLGVDLVGWRQNGPVDEIYARLRTRIVDYVTLDATGTVIHGSKNAEKFMEYEWTLVRETGVVTGVNDGVTVHNCPNCGAVLNINQTAKCEYCGSIITVNAHDWVVSGIKGLSQRTS